MSQVSPQAGPALSHSSFDYTPPHTMEPTLVRYSPPHSLQKTNSGKCNMAGSLQNSEQPNPKTYKLTYILLHCVFFIDYAIFHCVGHHKQCHSGNGYWPLMYVKH